MNTNLTDLDPLNTYDYSYNYDHIQAVANAMTTSYNIKMEQSYYPTDLNNVRQTVNVTAEQTEDNVTTVNEQNKTVIEDSAAVKTEDVDIKPVIQKKKKKSGKTSSYWNKKIEDKNFPFYGCTICNISFSTINELDQHVTKHKGRLTSYDLRLKNQKKRKLKKKEQKKLQKMGKKVKRENLTPEIEIKPEDGYIGNETASEFNLNNGENVSNAQNDNLQNNSNINEGNSNIIEGNSNKNEGNSNISEGNSNINEGNSNKSETSKEDPRLEKLFKCFACHKQFSLSYYLKLHVRSHTDEKPYKCGECGQSFITASKRGRHNKRIHLAIRFQCRICFSYFSRFEYLTRHFDKKHIDDKLDGEPYDYNAILPYLKELEQELQEKPVKDEKPKTEELWSEWTAMDHLHETLLDQNEPDCQVSEDHDNKEFVDQGDISVEDIKIDYEEDMDIKKESECDDVKDDSFHDDNVKDESLSDEDYFPLNTWAAPPDIEMGSTSPPPKSKRRKGAYPQQCDFCDKVINSASYMKVHLRTHSGERPFKCYICNRGFITSSKMHRHILTHSETWGDGEDQVKIEVEVKNEEEGDKVKKRKTSIKKAKAKLNKKKISGFSLKKEYKKRPFSCVYCHQRFLHKETMIVHRKSHDGEKLVLRCYFCLDEMLDEDTLSSHEATHSGPKPFLCTLCNRSYTKKETMIYHRKTHSTDVKDKKEFICDICSKTFNAQCKLQRHIVSHQVDKFVLRYECPVCAHMFNTKYHVQMHLATHQKEGLILEESRNEILAMVLQNARKIPKKSDAPMNLTDLMPSDERSRVCNICGQVFQHFYYLEEHLKSHGSKIALEDESKPEIKKHICQVCNKGFKLHYYLKLHSFTHTKEKPFICQQCGKGFITKGKLKRHLETHTGLKKYQCHICYKFFTRPSYLRIHVRTIHGTQDYNFSVDKQYAPLTLGLSI